MLALLAVAGLLSSRGDDGDGAGRASPAQPASQVELPNTTEQPRRASGISRASQGHVRRSQLQPARPAAGFLRVLDAGRRPVQGAAVAVLRSKRPKSLPDLVGRTNAAGRIRLEPDGSPTEAGPGARGALLVVSEQGVEIVQGHVRAGQTTDVVLDGAGRLTANVRTDSGRPVAKARVRLQPTTPALARLFPLLRDDALAATTDENGAATIVAPVLPDAPRLRGTLMVVSEGPATYDLLVEATGYRSMLLEQRLDSGATVVDVALHEDGTMGLRGTVLGETGRPRGGVAVVLDRRYSAVTDEGGEFALERLTLPAGTKSLRILGPGLVSRELDVDLGVGELDLGEIVVETAREVHGRVVDRAGEGVPSVLVQLRGVGRTEQVRSDGSGAFSFDGLAVGSYTLAVLPFAEAAYWDLPEPLRASAGGPPVLLNVDRSANSCVLDVRLVDETHAPLAPATVRVERVGDEQRLGRTRVDGAAVTAEVAPGTWRIWAVVPGLATARLDVAIPEGCTAMTAEIPVAPAASATGRLLLPELWQSRGEAAWLFFESEVPAPKGGNWDKGTLDSGSVQCASDGSFELSGLTPGGYRFLARGAGLVGYVQATLRAGGNELEIEASWERRVSFHSDLPGAAVDVAEVAARRAGGRDWQPALALRRGSADTFCVAVPRDARQWRIRYRLGGSATLEAQGFIPWQSGDRSMVVWSPGDRAE